MANLDKNLVQSEQIQQLYIQFAKDGDEMLRLFNSASINENESFQDYVERVFNVELVKQRYSNAFTEIPLSYVQNTQLDIDKLHSTLSQIYTFKLQMININNATQLQCRDISQKIQQQNESTSKILSEMNLEINNANNSFYQHFSEINESAEFEKWIVKIIDVLQFKQKYMSRVPEGFKDMEQRLTFVIDGFISSLQMKFEAFKQINFKDRNIQNNITYIQQQSNLRLKLDQDIKKQLTVAIDNLHRSSTIEEQRKSLEKQQQLFQQLANSLREDTNNPVRYSFDLCVKAIQRCAELQSQLNDLYEKYKNEVNQKRYLGQKSQILKDYCQKFEQQCQNKLRREQQNVGLTQQYDTWFTQILNSDYQHAVQQLKQNDKYFNDSDVDYLSHRYILLKKDFQVEFMNRQHELRQIVLKNAAMKYQTWVSSIIKEGYKKIQGCMTFDGWYQNIQQQAFDNCIEILKKSNGFSVQDFREFEIICSKIKENYKEGFHKYMQKLQLENSQK